jgi:hypothetical protein
MARRFGTRTTWTPLIENFGRAVRLLRQADASSSSFLANSASHELPVPTPIAAKVLVAAIYLGRTPICRDALTPVVPASETRRGGYRVQRRRSGRIHEKRLNCYCVIEMRRSARDERFAIHLVQVLLLFALVILVAYIAHKRSIRVMT